MKKIYICGVMALIISALFLTKTAVATSVSFEHLGETYSIMGAVGVQKFRDGNTVCYVVMGSNGSGAGISCVRVK